MSDKKDAKRYRFLRDCAKRAKKAGFNCERELVVEVHDWPKNLGGTGGFWSSMPLGGRALDREVDKMIKKL